MRAAPAPSCSTGDHAAAAAPAHPGATPAVLARAAGMLRAAGDPARLAVLDLLGAGPLCVTDVAARTGDALPAVSQQLRVLRTEGLVTARREGKHVFYALAAAPTHAHHESHTHGVGCGHAAVPHGDHTDYLIDGHLHHPHGDHCDFHGAVETVA